MMVDVLSSGDGFRPKRLSMEELLKEEAVEELPPAEPPVTRALSQLGSGEDVPTLARFMPDDDGDWYPGTLSPEVYETRVSGPSLECLNGVGFGLGWEIRGRLFHPKGVLPKSLFTQRQTISQWSRGFYTEVFFTIRRVEKIGDNECSYLAKFTPNPLWPEDWENYRPKKIEVPEGTPFLIDERLPQLFSHARGLGLTRYELDKIDGLQKLKLKQLLEKLQGPRFPPIFSHAHGLGLTMDYLDRIDGLIPVRADEEAGITLWRSAKFSEPSNICLPITVKSRLESDSTEVAMKAIFEETERLQKQKQAVAKTASPIKIKQENPADVHQSTENFNMPKKRSLRKRFTSFLRKHFCCASKNSQDN